MKTEDLKLSPEDQVRIDFLLDLKDKLTTVMIEEVLAYGKDDPNLGGMLSGMVSSLILDLETAYPGFARHVVLALTMQKLSELSDEELGEIEATVNNSISNPPRSNLN